MCPNPLKKIPSVSEILENPTVKGLVERMHPGAVLATARAVLDEVAAEVHAVATERTLPSMSELAERIARRMAADKAPGLRPAINATGMVFHPELGPPPLADRAVEAAAAAWRGAMVGDEGPVAYAAPAETLLAQRTGAEAALVVGSEAGALALALAVVGEGQEVVVSRGQLVRRDGTHDVPGLAALVSVSLNEIGAVDGTSAEDFQRAISDWTSAVLWGELGPLPHAKMANQITLDGLVRLAHEHKLRAVCDLGPAAMIDLASFDLDKLPTVARAVAAGADLIVFGHELLGGPPCGLIVGRRELIDQARRHPFHTTVPTGRATAAALAVTLELSEDAEQARRTIPTLQLLTTSPDNLKNRATRLAQQMTESPAVASAEAVERTAPVAASPHLACELPTWCIAMTPVHMNVDRLSTLLRSADPAVLGRMEEDRLLLDLRSVLPRDDLRLVDATVGIPV
ncbi:MAG: L-seryl-tRNA(Sec) selenium transferase [Pirellulales bacterium]|nr:L-seryl-tRNA(Sec) selenium transferase [Pirellulales bacterium]